MLWRMKTSRGSLPSCWVFYGTNLLASLLAITTFDIYTQGGIISKSCCCFCTPYFFSCTQQYKHYTIYVSAINARWRGCHGIPLIQCSTLITVNFLQNIRNTPCLAWGARYVSLKSDLYLTKQWYVFFCNVAFILVHAIAGPNYTGNIYSLDSLRLRQNGRHLADDIFKWIFLNENVWLSINISLKFVPMGQMNNIPALIQILGADQATRHYLKQWWLRLEMHIWWHIYASLGFNELMIVSIDSLM